MAPAAVVVSDRPDLLVTAEPKSLQSIFVRDAKVGYNQFREDIPVISLSGIAGEERGRVRDEVSKACSEWGIFQVVDHGVPQELVDSMTQLSRAFFALPADQYDMTGVEHGRFVVSSHLQVKPDGWREVVEKYSESLMGLAYKLSGIMSEALGLDTEAVANACVQMDQKVVINHYHKCPQPDMTVGLKRHTDPGTITLLLQDQVGGLQATKDDGKNWITVEPIEGAFVINLGDHMHYLSNGKFKTADHQAVLNSNSSRLSIATFQSPAQEAIVYPLDGVVKEAEGEKCFMEEPITFAQMCSRKMSRDIKLARQK